MSREEEMASAFPIEGNSSPSEDAWPSGYEGCPLRPEPGFEIVVKYFGARDESDIWEDL